MIIPTVVNVDITGNAQNKLKNSSGTDAVTINFKFMIKNNIKIKKLFNLTNLISEFILLSYSIILMLLFLILL